MLLTTSLIPWRLLGVAALALALFGAGCWAGAHWVHADWAAEIAERAEAERQRIALIRDEQDATADAAYLAAREFEAERGLLEVTHAQALSTLRKSLRRPVSCPAGATLADVVLPAATLDSLRHAAGADRVPAPEPAGSEPDR